MTAWIIYFCLFLCLCSTVDRALRSCILGKGLYPIWYFFKDAFIFFILCIVGVLPACMYVCHLHAWWLRRPDEVTDGCDLLPQGQLTSWNPGGCGSSEIKSHLFSFPKQVCLTQLYQMFSVTFRWEVCRQEISQDVWGCWEPNVGPLSEQLVCSTAEPSLQPTGGQLLTNTLTCVSSD